MVQLKDLVYQSVFYSLQAMIWLIQVLIFFFSMLILPVVVIVQLRLKEPSCIRYVYQFQQLTLPLHDWLWFNEWYRLSRLIQTFSQPLQDWLWLHDCL